MDNENDHPNMGETGKGSGSLSRRNFLKIGIGFLTAVGILEAGGVGLLYLKPRDIDGEYGGVIRSGKTKEFPNNSVTEYPEGHFYLVRSEEGGFLALYNRCPHLGCTVHWEGHRDRFHCPCHASSFDSFGNHLDSPVPRALDLFPVEIRDEEVYVDTSQSIRREEFSPDQLIFI